MHREEIKFVEDFIEQAKKLKIAVVGESIIDEFIPVTYEGQSMKSFCPVFKDAGKEVYRQEGGALAIYNHLKHFVSEVDFFSNPKNTIVKTRFIDLHSGQKHIEWNKFKEEEFTDIEIDCSKYDAVIVADFGHGVCNKLSINDGFHLMCQTNSNNFGFNRLSKWKSYKKMSVCADLREASLQINRRLSECTDTEAKEIYNYELNTRSLYITLGKKGALYTNGQEVERMNSFPTQIIDTIGAGDTFFSFAVLSEVLEVPKNKKLLIPSLAASLSTTWLCNEKSVTPQLLINHTQKYF